MGFHGIVNSDVEDWVAHVGITLALNNLNYFNLGMEESEETDFDKKQARLQKIIIFVVSPIIVILAILTGLKII